MVCVRLARICSNLLNTLTRTRVLFQTVSWHVCWGVVTGWKYLLRPRNCLSRADLGHGELWLEWKCMYLPLSLSLTLSLPLSHFSDDVSKAEKQQPWILQSHCWRTSNTWLFWKPMWIIRMQKYCKNKCVLLYTKKKSILKLYVNYLFYLYAIIVFLISF